MPLITGELIHFHRQYFKSGKTMCVHSLATIGGREFHTLVLTLVVKCVNSIQWKKRQKYTSPKINLRFFF